MGRFHHTKRAICMAAHTKSQPLWAIPVEYVEKVVRKRGAGKYFRDGFLKTPWNMLKSSTYCILWSLRRPSFPLSSLCDQSFTDMRLPGT